MEPPSLEGQMQLGDAVAPAIVVCVLFFIAAVIAFGNLVYTHWRFYIVLVISTLFRAVAYANRAAYLSHFRPDLEGVFLAFANAGYGINLAVLFLAQMTWCGLAVLPNMSAQQLKFWKILSILLIFPIIAYGPIIGVIAAGFLFGDLTPHGQSVGSRLRDVATWGLWGCTLSFTLTSGPLFVAALRAKPAAQHFIVDASGTGNSGTDASNRRTLTPQRYRQQLMIGILCGISVLLQVRALYNVVLLYPEKAHLADDHHWYALSTLPELLALIPLLWPTLLARIALFWPRPAAVEDGAGGKGPDSSRGVTNGRSVADDGSGGGAATEAV